MTDRPLLRLLNPREATRQTGAPRVVPRPAGPGRRTQGRRFQPTFDRLSEAFEGEDPAIELRLDPAGIAPERALVFVTAGEIQNFARAAQAAGLEVIAELGLEDTDEFPGGFAPPGDAACLSPALYTTMPTIASFNQLLTLWRAYGNNENAPRGAGPWWNLFDLLLELRPWGPEDRFPKSVRAVVADRLPLDDDEEARLEFEIWPTTNTDKRLNWRRETEARVVNLGGRIVDRSSIASEGFIYEALLVGLRAGLVRELLDNPAALDGLAAIDGLQFILPQTVAQSPPVEHDDGDAQAEPNGGFDTAAPARAALFDGTPVAAHPVLDGAVFIEDVHDLVSRSQVNQRFHATSMASIILRGDLVADGSPLADSRLVCVPLLIDGDGGASSPPDKLFVDLMHVALTRLLLGDVPLAPDVFVVNVSLGLHDVRFAGRISALARLIDWWAEREGVLFVISAGNIPEDIILTGVGAYEFENADLREKRRLVRTALRAGAFDRCLLAPAEALNGITVGAVSEEFSEENPPPDVATIFRLETDEERLPPITSALGLGPFRAIKPDLLASGGIHEVRVWPNGNDARLSVVEGQRTGIAVASARVGAGSPTQRARGTSCAAAFTTRAILQSAEAIMSDDGPYQGQELPREDIGLLTRALAVNSARWPESADSLYREELRRLGARSHDRAKEEVAKQFGHGILDSLRMQESPGTGVTLVGLGYVRKNTAQVFDMPLPASMSGDQVPRSMRVTLAWNSPVNPTRARYRLAAIEAIAADADDEDRDNGWGLLLKAQGPSSYMVRRGTVWSRRLIHDRLAAPSYQEGASVPIRVQCRDSAGGALDPNTDIRFAIAITLEVEAEVQYDIYQEVRDEIVVRARDGGG